MRQLGQPFSIVVPNGKKKIEHFPFSGEKEASVKVLSVNGAETRKNATMIACDQSQSAQLIFNQFEPGHKLILVVQEDGEVLTRFFEGQVKGQNHRAYIEGQTEKLYPEFKHKSCLAIDQCFYIRGFGIIELAKDLDLKFQCHLSKQYDMFSGIGYGAIIAAWLASGKSLLDLKEWWEKDLRKAVTGLSFSQDGRRNPRKLINTIRKAFLVNKRDLTLAELEKDLFLPCMDISQRPLAIHRKAFPVMPVYQAIACSLIDNERFKSKPMVKGYSVMMGDFVKSPVNFFKNSNIVVTNLSCPSRMYDHGKKKRSLQQMAIIRKEIAFSREHKERRNLIEYLCHPIDGAKSFDTRKKAIEAAIHSGKGVINGVI
jgi:hypothetical protein